MTLLVDRPSAAVAVACAIAISNLVSVVAADGATLEDLEEDTR